jgi:hypothetical protein
MPRKVAGERHEVVISTKITATQYGALKAWAKEYYLKNKLTQPNISQLLNYIVKKTLDIHAKDLAKAKKFGSDGDIQSLPPRPNTDTEPELISQTSPETIFPSSSRLSKPQESQKFENFKKQLDDL